MFPVAFGISCFVFGVSCFVFHISHFLFQISCFGGRVYRHSPFRHVTPPHGQFRAASHGAFRTTPLSCRSVRGTPALEAEGGAERDGACLRVQGLNHTVDYDNFINSVVASSN